VAKEAIVEKKEVSQRLHITKRNLLTNKRVREECILVTVIARWLYRKRHAMTILQW